MKNWFFICLFCFPILAISQDSVTNNILSTKKFRKGIYYSFKEFRDNSPSTTNEFRVEADSSKFDRYKLLSATNKKIKNVYGFCDGSYLYLNARTYGQGSYFVRILALGKIIYFEDKRGKKNAFANEMSGVAVMGGAIGGALVGAMAYGFGKRNANENPGWVIYMADETGEPFILDHVTLSSILKEADPQLNQEFKSRKDKNRFDVLVDFMNQFNQKNNSN